MQLENIISYILSLVSIILGIVAIAQAIRYNKDTNKLSSDIKYMLVQQIRMLNEVDRALKKANTNPGIIDMSKDIIVMHKLSSFRKSDVAPIMEEVRHLAIKRRFLSSMEEFLKSERVDFQCDFFCKAAGDEEVSIESIYMLLLQHNIVVSVRY